MDDKDRIKLLIDFYYSPWGAAKGERWEWFVRDMLPFNHQSILTIIKDLMTGSLSVSNYKWEALDGYAN